MTSFWPINRRNDDKAIRHFAIFLLVVIGSAISIVYANVQTYDPIQTPNSGYSDTVDYMNMYRGGTGSGIRAYRPLVPVLARLIPDPPRALFNERRTAVSESTVADARRVALKFGMVNFVFLVGSCIAFYVLLRDFEYSANESYLGVALFLSSQAVVRSAGLPMTDTAFYFFFLVCLIGLVRNQFWTVILAATVGVLAKELIVLAAPLALLTSHNRYARSRLFAATLPAVLLHVVVRITSNAPSDTYSIGQVIQLRAQLRALLSPNGILNVIMAFGLVWIAAAYGATTGKIPETVRRWSWLAPLVFVGVLLTGGNLGRSTFTAFPIVIPVAMTGIFAWGGYRNTPGSALS